MSSMQKWALVTSTIAVGLWLTQGTTATRPAGVDSLDAARAEPPAVRRVADTDGDDGPIHQAANPFDAIPPVPDSDTSRASLPPLSPEAVDVVADGRRYWYDRGHWYLEDAAGWSDARPPAGPVVPAIPPDYETRWIDDVPYYYLNGVYYLPVPHGYRVVDPALAGR